jgi:hypothetical protein
MQLSSNVRKVVAGVGAAAIITLGVAVAAGQVLAQSPTPTSPSTPSAQNGVPGVNAVPGLPFFGGSSLKEFDAAAKALNLTPVQLFEQLDAGKTLQEVATAQGVNLQTVQTAVNALRVQAEKDAIAQAVKDGRMTQAQADWLLQGIANGYIPGGPGEFGFGRGGRGGPGIGFGVAPQVPSQLPSATPGTSS